MASIVIYYLQPWTPAPAPNAQEPVPPNASADKSSEATNSGDVAKSIGRKELPAVRDICLDFFSSLLQFYGI